ncbi:MAG: GGDEF domain-containing protein, partial [Halarcobacter sp.]
TDALTNVYNRRFLEDFSNNYLKILKREKKKLSLLVIDIDDFKNINDTYGHEVGDIVIKDLVTRINNVIRENDILVRYGGDEFIILLPNSDISNAKKIGKKIIKNINLINELEEKKVNFSISVGAGEYKETDTDIEAILRRADEALYKAKSDGKSCVR